jgi:hypothetical protein
MVISISEKAAPEDHRGFLILRLVAEQRLGGDDGVGRLWAVIGDPQFQK